MESEAARRDHPQSSLVLYTDSDSAMFNNLKYSCCPAITEINYCYVHVFHFKHGQLVLNLSIYISANRLESVLGSSMKSFLFSFMI